MTSPPPTAAARVGIDWAIAAALLVLALGYWVWTASLFPLAEYRDWIANANIDFFPGILRSDRANGLSLNYVAASGRLCGLSLSCLNGTALAPLIVSAPLLFLLARRLHLSRAWSAFAALSWLGSSAVLASVEWQATICDRLALALAFGTLALPVAVGRSSFRPSTLVATNLATLALLFGAFNSKESAWFVAPALVLWALLMPELAEWRLRAIGRRLGAIFVPLAYAGYRGVTYFHWLRSSTEAVDWKHHVTGGSPMRNLGIFLRVLVDFVPLDREWLVAAVVAVLIVGCAWRAAWPQRRLLLFCWGAFVLAFALTLPTQGVGLYYMCLPGAMGWLALAATLSGLGTERLQRWRWASEAIVLAALVKVSLWGYFASAEMGYQQRLANHLRQSIALIGERVVPEQPTTLTVVYPSELPPPWRFRLVGGASSLWRWFGVEASVAPAGVIEEIFDRDPRARAPLPPGQVRISFDQMGRIVTIESGDHVLFRRDVAADDAEILRRKTIKHDLVAQPNGMDTPRVDLPVAVHKKYGVPCEVSTEMNMVNGVASTTVTVRLVSAPPGDAKAVKRDIEAMARASVPEATTIAVTFGGVAPPRDETEQQLAAIKAAVQKKYAVDCSSSITAEWHNGVSTKTVHVQLLSVPAGNAKAVRSAVEATVLSVVPGATHIEITL